MLKTEPGKAEIMMQPAGAEPSQESAPARKKHWLAWLLVLLVCAVLMLPLLHRAKAPGGPMPGGGPGVPVTTVQVRSGSMDIFLDALGTVTPLQTVNVYSQVSGQVLSVNFREGELVRKGQLLAVIDSGPTQAQLEQAQGSLARDRALLEQARVNLKRYQEARNDYVAALALKPEDPALVRHLQWNVELADKYLAYQAAHRKSAHAPARQPEMAPSPATRPVQALAWGCVPPVSWSAHSGIHCTVPQVPMSTMAVSPVASSVTRRSPGAKISLTGFAGAPSAACRHFYDSGTNWRMKNVSRAGSAPTSTTQRQECTVTEKKSPMMAMRAKPTLAAAPMMPESMGRDFSGQTSITSATPSDHSPPMPSAAQKRVTARYSGVWAK